MTVSTKEQAWAEVNKIFPTDYEKDYASSERAGYDIYRHSSLNYYCRICDLGNRLEVMTGEYGEIVSNIWIEAPKAPATYKAIITYQIHDGSVMTKEMTDVRGTEVVWERIGGEDVQVFKVNHGSYSGVTWAAGAILTVTMIPERK